MKPSFQADQPSRRLVCLALAALSLAPRPVLARGGGGGNQELSSAKPKKRSRNTATEWSYTQRAFIRLSQREIHALIRRWQRRSIAPDVPRFHIEGFSYDMSVSILWMALRYRRRTYRLIRDMQRLNSNGSRRARLKREEKEAIREGYRLVSALGRTLNMDDPDESAATEAKNRLAGADTYLRTVRHWLKTPSEGTR